MEQLKKDMQDCLANINFIMTRINTFKQQDEQYVLDFLDELNKISITY